MRRVGDADHMGPRRRGPAWTWLLPLISIVLALSIPAFLWYAYKAILGSTDGSLEVAITDPSAPGYETLVVPTPSHMVFGVDEAGDLTMVVVMSLASNDEGGSVLLLPPETIADGTHRLKDVYASGGLDAVRSAVAKLVGAEVDAVSVLDPTSWAQFTAASTPMRIVLPEALVLPGAEGADDIAYPAGPVELTAVDIASVLSWLNPGEDPFNRIIRQRHFWEAWAASIAEAGAGPDVVPGEADSGLGRMLLGLGKGTSLVHQAPVSALTTAPSGAEAFLPLEAELREIVAAMIPFPIPAEPGGRARLRLLDGVGGLDVASRFSPALVRAGAQIILIGNAIEFGLAETAVVYHSESFLETAQGFADAVGGARLTHEPATDVVVDITVIIGIDQGRSTG
jgi:hypothetical protein